MRLFLLILYTLLFVGKNAASFPVKDFASLKISHTTPVQQNNQQDDSADYNLAEFEDWAMQGEEVAPPDDLPLWIINALEQLIHTNQKAAPSRSPYGTVKYSPESLYIRVHNLRI